MSALPPKADITEGYEKCPLMTQSGHSLDYGVQKVFVSKTRDLRMSQQGERLVKIFDGLIEVCTGKDRQQW